MGQHVGLREEIVLAREAFLHPHQVASQHILLGQVVNTRQMVASLPRFHFLQNPNGYGTVPPGEVPLIFLLIFRMVLPFTHYVSFLGQVEVQLKLGDLLNDIVVAATRPYSGSVVLLQGYDQVGLRIIRVAVRLVVQVWVTLLHNPLRLLIIRGLVTILWRLLFVVVFLLVFILLIIILGARTVPVLVIALIFVVSTRPAVLVLTVIVIVLATLLLFIAPLH